ncbi:hypothetical protein BaRGS_00034246 [Batillaria attramentaria]|uniref:Uncharacterized protein n=1 Tax=Batillaria attramentaria TaxID=370345 RepID=A0ABD0JHT8_9CAEN
MPRLRRRESSPAAPVNRWRQPRPPRPGTGDFRPSGLPIDLFVSDKLKAQILQGDCIDLAQLLSKDERTAYTLQIEETDGSPRLVVGSQNKTKELSWDEWVSHGASHMRFRSVRSLYSTSNILVDTLDRRGTGFMSPEFLKKMADKDASGSDAGGRDAGSEMELTGQSKTILDVMKGLFAEFAQTTDAKIERLSQEVARTKRDRYESDSESESDVSSTECKKRKTDSDPDVLVVQENINLDETELAFLKR